MLGSFAALYKFILNALPILYPSPILDRPLLPLNRIVSPATEPPTPLINVESGGYLEQVVEKRSAHLTVRAQFVRKQTKRWHAAIAGFISGGVAVSFEAKARRLAIAQQLFVRYVVLLASCAASDLKHLQRFARQLQWNEQAFRL
jgi:hypothetical protein